MRVLARREIAHDRSTEGSGGVYCSAYARIP